MRKPSYAPIKAIERFLRIGDNLSADERLRSRVIYYTCLSYIVLQTINLTYLTIWEDGFQFQRPIGLATLLGFVGAILLLRVTKSKSIFGIFFTVLPLLAVLTAATNSPAAQASMALGGGINTPTLPILCVGAVIAAMVGSRATATLYVVASSVLLLWLMRVSAGFATDPLVSIVGLSRAIQVGIGVALLCVIGFTLSRLSYRAINGFEKALNRAKRAEDARKELLATMSHEIRTPLNGIIAVSDLLAKHKHDATTDTHLNIISLSAANLLEIVNESLGRARSEHLGELEALEITVSQNPFDPAAVLQQTCDLFTAHADQKGLWIGTFGLETLPKTVLGDAPHLRQVMNNLVGNALKFTKDGGVRLGARQIDETDVTSVIQFFVQDTGVGIEDEAMARIFERFGQSGSALTTDSDGSGLGLAICNDFVSAMGGKIDVSSTIGTGTTFSFTLTLPKMSDDVKVAA